MNELANRFGTQSGNPVDTVHLPQLVDLGLGDHSAVAHHHKLLDAEALLHLFYLRQQRFGIARVALKDGYRHGDAAFVGQQTVVDLQLAFLAVTVVSEAGDRTTHTLEVA